MISCSRMTVVQAYLCSRHFKGGRSELPKLHELPRQVGQLVTQGISVNSSYSSDVKVSQNMSDILSENIPEICVNECLFS